MIMTRKSPAKRSLPPNLKSDSNFKSLTREARKTVYLDMTARYEQMRVRYMCIVPTNIDGSQRHDNSKELNIFAND